MKPEPLQGSQKLKKNRINQGPLVVMLNHFSLYYHLKAMGVTYVMIGVDLFNLSSNFHSWHYDKFQQLLFIMHGVQNDTRKLMEFSGTLYTDTS